MTTNFIDHDYLKKKKKKHTQSGLGGHQELRRSARLRRQSRRTISSLVGSNKKNKKHGSCFPSVCASSSLAVKSGSVETQNNGSKGGGMVITPNLKGPKRRLQTRTGDHTGTAIISTASSSGLTTIGSAPTNASVFRTNSGNNAQPPSTLSFYLDNENGMNDDDEPVYGDQVVSALELSATNAFDVHPKSNKKLKMTSNENALAPDPTEQNTKIKKESSATHPRKKRRRSRRHWAIEKKGESSPKDVEYEVKEPRVRSTKKKNRSNAKMNVTPPPLLKMRAKTVGKRTNHEGSVTDNHHMKPKSLRSQSSVEVVVKLEEDENVIESDFSEEEEEENEVDDGEDEDEKPIPWVDLDQLSRDLFSLTASHKNHHALNHSFLAVYGSEYHERLLARSKEQRDRLVVVKSEDDEAPVNRSSHTMTTRKRKRSISSWDGLKLYDSGGQNSSSKDASFHEKPKSLIKVKKNGFTSKYQTREDVVCWIVETCYQFDFKTETVHLSVKLLDQCYEDEEESMLCYGCACLLIAAKLVESKAPSAATLAFFTENNCPMNKITDAEMKISMSQKFKLHFVTAYHFAHRFIFASRTVSAINTVLTNGDDVHSLDGSKIVPHFESGFTTSSFQALVFYFLELSLFDDELAKIQESTITAAAVYLARAILGMQDDQSGKIWDEGMTQYTGIPIEDLKTICIRLHCLQSQAHSKKQTLKVVMKYQTEEFFAVSTRCAILFQDLCLSPS